MLREAISSLCSKLGTPIRRAERISRFPKREFGSQVKVPISIRLQMIRNGFLSRSYVFYQLDKNDPSQYLNDLRLYILAPDIVGKYRVLLHDKLLFTLITRAFPANEVKLLAAIRNGKTLYTGDKKVNDATDYLLGLLQMYPKVVIKPVLGHGGQDIRFLSRQHGKLLLNETPVSEAQLRDLTGKLTNDLVTCYVEQHPEIAALYPRTVNTVRLVTMQDVENGEPFIAAAMLRIGCASSYPVDNWVKGGLSAGIDIETGTLSKGSPYPVGGRALIWYAEHPESRTQIEGFVVPRWREIKATMLDICRSVPFLQYVGWDLAITDDGFKILEGNHNPDLCPHQMHGPLLTDPRIVRFLKAHRIL